MKKLIFTALSITVMLFSFSQTDSSRANEIIARILQSDAVGFSKDFDNTSSANLAVNDCNPEAFYTPIDSFLNKLEISKKVISLIKKEVGQSFTLTWATCIEFEYFPGTPLVAAFILKNKEGKKIKIDLFMTREFKIKDVTICKSNCNHF